MAPEWTRFSMEPVPMGAYSSAYVLMRLSSGVLLSTYAFVAASVLAAGVATFVIRLDPIVLSKPYRLLVDCVAETHVRRA